MSFYSFIQEAQADEFTENIYLEIKNTFGVTFIPDFFKAISNNKTIFEGLWSGYANILADGVLPLQLKEMIFLIVALNKGCVYCSSTHLAVCDMIGIEKDNISNMINDIESLTPKRNRDILIFVLKLINNPTEGKNEDFDVLQKHGLSPEEITEVIAMATLSNTAVNMALAMGLKSIEHEIKDYLDTENLKTGLEEN